MISYEDLDAAIDQGIIGAEDASVLKNFVAARKKSLAGADERFKLISGFNDIFVVIASGLLLLAVGWIAQHLLNNWSACLCVSAVCWLLGEYLIRNRRMSLPAIMFTVVYALGIFLAVRFYMNEVPVSAPLACIMMLIGCWGHWLRFRVPITVAMGLIGVGVCIISGMLYAVPETQKWINFILFLLGVAAFAFAMRWDGSDRYRRTRRSDVAFWLHLLAAPLLIHPIFQTVTELDTGGSGKWMFILPLYGVVCIVSLLTDRRALMVSALIYVLYTFTALMQEAGMVELGFAASALMIGAGLLILSIYWQRCRTFLLQHTHPYVRERVPPGHLSPD